ncbi:MAG: c-type cytochrome biogenesis protein CcsB [Candidatus Omnitrophica bacterium]|nr:c-type cytochrome biogenesis protein CcsB [Candidatus Omnitrophota bacterium]
MYTVLFFGALLSYFVGAVIFVIFSTNKHPGAGRVAVGATLFGFISHTASLILRAVISGFPPMSNLYESMTLFAWAVVLAFLVIEYKVHITVIGAFVMPVAFLITGYASLLDSTVRPLMPALQSYWLFIHVMSCFISYACFACAFCLGIMYLFQERQVKSKHIGKIFERLPSLDVMDRINYNTVLLGFVLLTAGIVTGSIWAQQAWGNWWSWDPKETWSFITWLVYAAYLHSRFNAGWRGRRTAVMSIIGFLSVLFTYLGVSFLLPGLHSYF